MDIVILNNQYLLVLVSLFVGVGSTILAQLVISRRGLLTYVVRHDRVGISRDDPILGTVTVKWNDTIVDNLFHSTIELVNESFKDFENVSIRVFTHNTILLSERTAVVGTSRVLTWTKEYADALKVEQGHEPTEQQLERSRHQRDYIVPTLNRGQIIRLSYLNAASGTETPSIWIDVIHKGLQLRFKQQQNQIFGSPQQLAGLVGIFAGIAFAVVVVLSTDVVWVAAFSCLVFGLGAQIIGAFIVRAWRKLRNALGG